MSKDKVMVAGYARVSTENQLENYSIQEQIERLQAYCTAKGWVLVKTYTDGGYSGGNTNRPALQQMLESVRTGNIDIVLVYKLDRLSRSQKDTLTLIEDEILAHGSDFVSICENFDTSTPFGRAMIGILSVFAQLEKDQITERFTMGRIGRGKAGYFHGGGNPPTGYDYVDGMLQVNEYEAMQVRETYDMFLAGKSINAIYRSLNNKYVTAWTATKVRNVLRNSLYIGKVKFRGVEYDGQHEPLVEPDTYAAVQRLLNSFDRESSKSSSQKNPFRSSYLLSGLLHCKRCGSRYSANHSYYKCYSRAKSCPKYVVDPNCKNDNWKIEDLDSVVTEQATTLCAHPDLVDCLIASAAERTIKIDKTKIRHRISELDGQLEKLIDLYQLSAIPMDTLTSRANQLSAEKAALVEQLNAPDEIPQAELFVAAVQNFNSGFDKADTDNRRALLSALIERIDIDGQAISITWRI